MGVPTVDCEAVVDPLEAETVTAYDWLFTSPVRVHVVVVVVQLDVPGVDVTVYVATSATLPDQPTCNVPLPGVTDTFDNETAGTGTDGATRRMVCPSVPPLFVAVTDNWYVSPFVNPVIEQVFVELVQVSPPGCNVAT